MRTRDLVLNDARVIVAPLLLTAPLATSAAIAVSEKAWLYTLVIAALGVADLPLVARVRVRRGTTVALLTHAGVLVVGWFVAFLVWAHRPLGVIDATRGDAVAAVETPIGPACANARRLHQPMIYASRLSL